MSGYEELANAVIIQAAKDFTAAYKRMKRFPNDTRAQDEVREITKFFCSQWFEVLSDADGPTLLRKIKDEIDAGESRPVRRKKER
ncbi:MAG: hypothetical protein K6G66_12880 [Oscillospiraceae bacterium]|nr:hypothetical protein [Oscillospiraceae bacterium]